MKILVLAKVSMLVLFTLLLLQNPVAAQTEVIPAGRIVFINASISQMAAIMAKLSKKPIVVSREAGSRLLSYQNQQPATREEVFKEFANRLGEQGCALVNINDEAFKLVPVGETNKQGNFPRIQIDVQTNSIVVDRQSVALSELWDVIKQRVTPETEIWIHDANPDPEPGVKTPGKKFIPSTNPPWKVTDLLIQSKVRAGKIYQAYFP